MGGLGGWRGEGKRIRAEVECVLCVGGVSRVMNCKPGLMGHHLEARIL